MMIKSNASHIYFDENYLNTLCLYISNIMLNDAFSDIVLTVDTKELLLIASFILQSD